MSRSLLHHSSIRNRGSALVPSLVVVMVAAGMGVAMLQMMAGSSKLQRQSTDKKRAFYIAEAGLAESFMSLTKGMSGNIGTPERPATFGDGVYWVEAKDLTDGKVALISTGLAGSGRFCAALTVEKQKNFVGMLGVFGQQSLNVGGSCIIDGYDSTLGTFESQAKETPLGLTTSAGASVNANSSIFVSGPAITFKNFVPSGQGPATTIFGNAHPGPGSSVVAMPGSQIAGSTSPNPKPLELPPIVAPEASTTVSLTTTATNQEIPASQVAYKNVTVKGDTTLHLRGPLILTAELLTIKSKGKLNFDTTNGPITIYTTKGLVTEAGSEFLSVRKNPRDVAILVANTASVDYTGDGRPDPPVTLLGGGVYYGVLYAPKVNVTIPSTLRFFGGAAALNLSLAQNARVTFDKSITKCATGASSLPGMISWKIMELPDVPLVKSGRDPLVQLREMAVTPVKSDQAFVDNGLQITYIDNAGNVQTFTGSPRTIDWAAVKAIINKIWTTTP